MRFYLTAVFLLPSLLLLTACQITSENSASNSPSSEAITVLPLASAVQINYQDEVKLFRINQLLADQQNYDEQQRARLYYDRGIIHDRIGLSVHSRYDFAQAINLDPLFAPAYNSLGLYLLVVRSYEEAFEAFDSALELSEKMQFSYLHRAIGLYQVERYSLASEDIEKFYALDVNDPYRILWRYIINSKLDPQKALLGIQAVNKALEDHRYAWLLVDVIAGRTTESEFLQRISYAVQSNTELAQRLCEAYFYLGHWHKLAGNLNRARYYFKLSTATNIHDFIEYKYSLIELASINSKLQIELEKQ